MISEIASLETSQQRTHTDQTHLRKLCYHSAFYSGNESTSLPIIYAFDFFWHHNQIWGCMTILLEGEYKIYLTTTAQDTTLNVGNCKAASYILLPYHSVIFWCCRKWGSILEITFHLSNYLSTILHLTQSTARSHHLPLNIDDQATDNLDVYSLQSAKDVCCS